MSKAISIRVCMTDGRHRPTARTALKHSVARKIDTAGIYGGDD